ncbi:hypothetical protein Bca101_077697 [Brassica carinata]
MKCSVNRSPVPDEDVTVASEKEELTLGEIINIKLVESGEKDNPMELVRDRLVESGWKDEMRVACSFGTRCCEARAAEQNSKLLGSSAP